MTAEPRSSASRGSQPHLGGTGRNPAEFRGGGTAFGRMHRKEDARFVRGRGTFVDDVRLPGMLHGAVLRSPLAHARIVSVDTSAATNATS